MVAVPREEILVAARTSKPVQSRSMQCPCCHQETGRLAPRSVLDFGEFRPTARRIIAYLYARFGQRIGAEELADWVYRERTDGGPISARQYISNTIRHTNKTLAKYGLVINGGRGQGGYCLTWSDT